MTDRQPRVRFAVLICDTCRNHDPGGAKNAFTAPGQKPPGCTCKTVWRRGEGPRAARAARRAARQAGEPRPPAPPSTATPPV